MSKYRNLLSSGSLPDASQSLAQRAPNTPLKSSKKLSKPKHLSRFKLDSPMIDELFNNVNVPPCQGTVHEEFDKYTAALLSPPQMDLLNFWEVSYTHIDEDKQH